MAQIDGTGEQEFDAIVWRERAQQLQVALDSRVVIEQAKGILAERFGLDMESAFAVLRLSARSARVKIHALADAVDVGYETPQQIIHWLAKHPEIVEQPSRDERVFRTVADFKRLNDELVRELGAGNGSFLCECGNPHCNVRLELSPMELRELHTRGLFAILPGHDIPEIETVVTSNARYAAVRKRSKLH
jgi:hypothetical protein